MLKIRLQRTGRKNQPSFRVVLQEQRWAASGKAKELLGFYNPRLKQVGLKGERIKYWLQVGAQASPTVHNLLVKQGVIEGGKVRAWRPKRKEKQAEEVSAAVPFVKPVKEEIKNNDESGKEKIEEIKTEKTQEESISEKGEN